MIVVIGNSIAAISAVEKIREYDKNADITIISDEKYHVYSRPMIPGFLYDEYDFERMLFRDKDFYKKNKIKTIFGKKAVKINEKKKQVILENKRKLNYSKLLIAAGGTPFIPPIKGYGKDVITFTKLEDAKKIKEMTLKFDKFLVIGAGLIGLKAAEALCKAGAEATVIELADRVLPAITDKKASKIFTHLFKEKGIEIHLKCSVDEILRKEGRITAVKLNNNKKIECESVVCATGVKPNMELTKGTSIKTNRGILVNEKMQTSSKDIYAAGDVAEAFDIINNENRNIPTWPNASLQGKIAGSNIAGVEEKYPGSYVMNSIGFFALPIISYGLVNAQEKDYETLKKTEKESYKKIILKDNRVVGAIFVNDIDRAGIINGIIRDKTDVSSFKEHLIDDALSFVYLPQKLRHEKLITVPKVKL